jgi:hypothetical protein
MISAKSFDLKGETVNRSIESVSRPPALTVTVLNTGILQLTPFVNTSQQEAAATHVTSSNKFRGKHQSRTKQAAQGLHIFRRRNTAEQYRFAVLAYCRREGARITLQGNTVS